MTQNITIYDGLPRLRSVQPGRTIGARLNTDCRHRPGRGPDGAIVGRAPADEAGPTGSASLFSRTRPLHQTVQADHGFTLSSTPIRPTRQVEGSGDGHGDLGLASTVARTRRRGRARGR